MSVHIRCIGDWTNAFAKSLGVDWDTQEKFWDVIKEDGAVVTPPMGKVCLRRVEERRDKERREELIRLDFT